MNDVKYIGLDVHQATISAAVVDSTGKLVMESILEKKATTVLQFIQGLRGSLRVTFEEGTCAAWLHDLLKPHVTEVLVCNPRKNALLKVGNKSDRIDARTLADLLHGGHLSSVYHGEDGVGTLKELAGSYLTITKDLSQVMNRLKAVYRSWAIPCASKLVYSPRHRDQWLQKLPEAGVRRRAERLYQQLDRLRSLRQTPGRNCWPRAGNIPRLDGYNRFLALARFELRCSSRCCRHRIAFAPSGNCGPTAVWPWPLGAARNSASWMGSSSVPKNSWPSVDSMPTITMI